MARTNADARFPLCDVVDTSTREATCAGAFDAEALSQHSAERMADEVKAPEPELRHERVQVGHELIHSRSSLGARRFSKAAQVEPQRTVARARELGRRSLPAPPRRAKPMHEHHRRTASGFVPGDAGGVGRGQEACLAHPSAMPKHARKIKLRRGQAPSMARIFRASIWFRYSMTWGAVPSSALAPQALEVSTHRIRLSMPACRSLSSLEAR
jgi:hypothetical protein